MGARRASFTMRTTPAQEPAARLPHRRHERCTAPIASESSAARRLEVGIALKTDDLRQRRLPISADIVGGQGVEFRVWAPRAQRVEVALESTMPPLTVPLMPEGNGYFSGCVREAAPGTRYVYRLDDAQKGLPDPASRFQPEGPHGASEVIDPGAFAWTDQDWGGVGRRARCSTKCTWARSLARGHGARRRASCRSSPDSA